MSDDVARFLQQINERRAQEQARQAQIARAQAEAQRRQAPQPTPAGGQAASWQYTSAEPLVEVEIVEDRMPQASRPDRPAQAPGRRSKQAPRPTPVETQQSGNYAPEKSLDQGKGSAVKAPAGSESIIELLRSPNQLRNAFLLGEIFRRPEW
jgi:hypothetical protein